jgi:hypothetical protein
MAGRIPAWLDDDPELAERTRWLWLLPLAAGLLAVAGWVIFHDPGPGLALSGRGWCTLVLAGLLAVLLGVHRRAETLLRALGEYAAVALLAVLLVTATGVQQQSAPAKYPASRAGAAARAADACPSVVELRAWLACPWNAGQQAARSHPPTTKPNKRHAMPHLPTPPLGKPWAAAASLQPTGHMHAANTQGAIRDLV